MNTMMSDRENINWVEPLNLRKKVDISGLVESEQVKKLKNAQRVF